MGSPDAPLTRERILVAAEDVVRRFGPDKATVLDVARALGVSHAAVYRHVTSKAELRDLVVGRWAEATMPPLRAIAAAADPAPQRLRRLFDALIAVKRRRAIDDPELFAAYRSLAAAPSPSPPRMSTSWSGSPRSSSARASRKARFAPSNPLPPPARCSSPRSVSTIRPTPPTGPIRRSTRRMTTCGSC